MHLSHIPSDPLSIIQLHQEHCHNALNCFCLFDTVGMIAAIHCYNMQADYDTKTDCHISSCFPHNSEKPPKLPRLFLSRLMEDRHRQQQYPQSFHAIVETTWAYLKLTEPLNAYFCHQDTHLITGILHLTIFWGAFENPN